MPLIFYNSHVKEQQILFQKLLKSAIANAEENHKVLDVEDLFVKNVTSR